jgi:hypothetical protein
MNLTDPPEVEDLTPDRADRLRADLVARAARDRTVSRPRRTWVPMIAAGAGVATVVAAVVLALPGDSDRPSAPPIGASSTPGSVSVPRGPVPGQPSTTPAPKWVAPPSGTLNLDLGTATEAEVRTMLDRCFQAPADDGFQRSDAQTAKIEWARWMVKPVTYTDDRYDTKPRRQLAASVARADNRAWTLCVDDPTKLPGTQMQGGWQGVSPDAHRTNGASAQLPVNGAASGGDGKTRDGRWVVTYSSSFDAIPRVAKAQYRITWPGGASPWHTAYVRDGTGYVDVAAIGPGTLPSARRIEVRLFDKQGRIFYNTGGTGDRPIGVR